MGLGLGYRSNWRRFDVTVIDPLTKPSSCEVCSAFTRVAACTLAQSPYFVTAIRGLQPFRLLHACPGCCRRERIAGWALHPLEKAPPCHGARGKRTLVFAAPFVNDLFELQAAEQAITPVQGAVVAYAPPFTRPAGPPHGPSGGWG